MLIIFTLTLPIVELLILTMLFTRLFIHSGSFVCPKVRGGHAMFPSHE
jgi:hypothetical protein